MTKSLQDMLRERPVDRQRVDAHKRRMLDETRAHALREVRESLHLTQVQVADLLHVSQNRVSRIESGDLERAQVDTLRRYVEAVGGELRIEVAFGDQRYKLV